jgi:hypothetical protein
MFSAEAGIIVLAWFHGHFYSRQKAGVIMMSDQRAHHYDAMYQDQLCLCLLVVQTWCSTACWRHQPMATA